MKNNEIVNMKNVIKNWYKSLFQRKPVEYGILYQPINKRYYPKVNGKFITGNRKSGIYYLQKNEYGALCYGKKENAYNVLDAYKSLHDKKVYEKVWVEEVSTEKQDEIEKDYYLDLV